MSKKTEMEMPIVPLDTFRHILGIDPYTFWQIKHPAHPLSADCAEYYVHYRWQSSNHMAGRHDFLQALSRAEKMLADRMQYWVGPKYTDSERGLLPQFKQVISYSTKPLSFEAKWRHIQKVGKLTWTMLSHDAVVTYPVGTDDAVITVLNVPAAVPECEIVVCYAGTQYARVRPIRASLSGTTATITINKWLMAEPTLWNTSHEIDAIVPANFMSKVDVYWRYIDTTDQLDIIWEPGIQDCGCLLTSCDTCAQSLASACAIARNYEDGVIGYRIADYSNGIWLSSSGCAHTEQPDAVIFSYEHGLPLYECRVNDYWAQIVTHLALALIPSTICGCGNVLEEVKYWQEDLGRAVTGQSWMMSQTNAENPFGTRRGAIEAWQAVLEAVGD